MTVVKSPTHPTLSLPVGNDYAVEQLLINRVLRGDQRAHTVLFRRYERLLTSVIGRYLREPEEVEETLQDTFLRAFRALPAFRGECRLGTWLCRVAISTAINRQRSRAYNRHKTGQALPDMSGLPPGAPEGIRRLERADTRRWVSRAIDCLSPADGELLRRFYLEEEPVREICRDTGRTEAAVKSRLYQARKRLRKVMERRFAGYLAGEAV